MRTDFFLGKRLGREDEKKKNNLARGAELSPGRKNNPKRKYGGRRLCFKRIRVVGCLGVDEREMENPLSPSGAGKKKLIPKEIGDRGFLPPTAGTRKLAPISPPLAWLGMRRKRGSPHEEGPPLSAGNKEKKTMGGGLSP